MLPPQCFILSKILKPRGSQIIGWDPYAQTIRSWLFDSDGGFGVGRWTPAGNRWTVKTLSVLPDGRRGSATNIYELEGDTVWGATAAMLRQLLAVATGTDDAIRGGPG